MVPAGETRRRGSVVRIWALSFAMVTVAAFVVGLLPSGPPAGSPFEVPWWAYALAFGVAEVTVIHLPVRRESHTISLSEIPLVVGLVFASPLALIASRLIGGGVALAFKRRNPPMKLAFNLALFWMETALTIAAYRLVLGDASPVSPTGWLAALVAVAVEVIVSAAMVDLAIAILNRQRPLADAVRSFAAGVLISSSAGLVGVVAVSLLWYDRRAGVLLILAAGVFALLLRVYGRLSSRYDELRSLYGFTNELDSVSSGAEIIDATLQQVLGIMRSERAELVWRQPGEDAAMRISAVYRGASRESAMSPDTVAQIIDIARADDPHRCLSPADEASVLRELLGPGVDCALVARVDAGNDWLGALIVSGRTGQERRYLASDLDLLDTLARQTSVALARALVIGMLREEIDAKQQVIRSKDQLIAAVSHELRTPLTGVLGFAETLRDHRHDYEDGERAAMLSSIASEALDLTNLVEDLLTAARAQIGSLTISPRPVDLRELAGRVVDQFGPDGRRVTLTGEPAVALVDEGRVRQIMRNLLSNAFTYGGHQIHIATFVDDAAAWLRVSDNGDGIPEQDQERIFSPYESAHDPGTQPGSLGLGLTISRSLAHLMGGELAYRRADGWTIFELSLTLADGPARRLDDVTLDGTVRAAPPVGRAAPEPVGPKDS